MREIEDIHVPFLAWLRANEIPFLYHRTDRKSGIRVGWPDFSIFWMSRAVLIEVKTTEGKLSKVQQNVHAFIRKSGNRVEVCRSLEDCKEAVYDILCEKSAVPVLAEPTKRESNVVKVHESEARESTSKITPDDYRLSVPRNEDSRGGAQFFIGDWQGTPYVFAPDLGGAFRMIREASMMDRLRLPKLP